MPEGLRRARRDFAARLELHYRDMQDIEFTIQDGKLWMLQTRSGKRTAKAAPEVSQSIWLQRRCPDQKEEAVMRVDPRSRLDQLLHPTLDPENADVEQ